MNYVTRVLLCLLGALVAVLIIALAGGFRRTPTRASFVVAWALIGASAAMIILAIR